MRNIFVASICAFIGTAAALDSSGKPHKGQPEVVSVYVNEMRRCSGVMIFDLTILIVSDCFMGYDDEKLDLTVKFTNDKKSYKAALKIYSKKKRDPKIYDVDLAVLTLDAKDNPPKCKWAFQLPESNKHGNEGKITLIRNLIDKDDVRTMDVKLDDCNKMINREYNVTESICVKGGATWETNYEDQGAPLFLNGKFTGVMRTQENRPYPSLFDNLYYEKEFFGELPQNRAQNKKPSNKEKT